MCYVVNLIFKAFRQLGLRPDEWWWDGWWNDESGRKRENHEKTVFVHHKAYMARAGFEMTNPSARGAWPNRWGTAVLVWYKAYISVDKGGKKVSRNSVW